MPAALSLLGIGWYVVVAIIGGIIGGLLLDSWLDIKPLFTLLGLLLGMTVAFYGAYRALIQVIDASKTKETDED